MSPYGPAPFRRRRVNSGRHQGRADAGNYAIYKGPLKDNKGKDVVTAGTSAADRPRSWKKMNYLVEGVIGATS